MAKFSQDLLDMLTEFFINEIGKKIFDGCTYAILTKEEADKSLFENYMAVRKEASKCGYSSSEVFRAYEFANGYVFDMDLNTAKKIAAQIAKAVAKENGIKDPVEDLIGEGPKNRKRNDMLALARYVKKEYGEGHRNIDIALYSRNSVPRIVINGIGQKDDLIAIKYNAYAIRQWDIEMVNRELLIPAGLRISKVEPCDVLPSKTGVRFRLYIEALR